MRGEKTLEIKQELGKILQTGKANLPLILAKYEYFMHYCTENIISQNIILMQYQIIPDQKQR